ncbi:probable serine/threonine-protein kinase clkA [Leptidea sinapis]|uniref:probable serine/threonine-protein kinase clkA n=1 Tax=Leptidea sinapis TaxID=189913 RepID=UPI0021C48C42|nr:probable serine/threonine-protein kinase clkA [Leptidea sinapis]
MYIQFFVMLFTRVWSQELPTPSSQLAPRHFNYHPYMLRQFLEETPAPTKQGPVLFPNNASPPPRPPLMVTSRPLAESVARSELNNSIAASSFLDPVTYRPNYLDDLNFVKEYETQSISPLIDYNSYVQPKPKLPKKNFAYGTNNNNYNGYNNGAGRGGSSDQDIDYSEAQNYAFSYVVKDQKTGDDFSHKQQSHGSATNGEYRVRLPDGRVQIVSYTADDNGYNADVRYEDAKNENYYNQNNNHQINDYSNRQTTNLNNYRDEIPVKENQYDSKELYDYPDYKNSDDFNLITTTFRPVTNKPYFLSTLKPAYDEIKHLFTTPNSLNIDINSPSSPNYDSATDNVVLIGGKNRYTDYTHLNNLNYLSTPTRQPSTYFNLNNKYTSNTLLSDSFISK